MKVTTAERKALSASLQQLITHVKAGLAGLLQSGWRHRSPCSNAGTSGFVGSVSWFHFTPTKQTYPTLFTYLAFHSSNNPNLSHPARFHPQNHFTWSVTSRTISLCNTVQSPILRIPTVQVSVSYEPIKTSYFGYRIRLSVYLCVFLRNVMWFKYVF